MFHPPLATGPRTTLLSRLGCTPVPLQRVGLRLGPALPAAKSAAFRRLLGTSGRDGRVTSVWIVPDNAIGRARCLASPRNFSTGGTARPVRRTGRGQPAGTRSIAVRERSNLWSVGNTGQQVSGAARTPRYAVVTFACTAAGRASDAHPCALHGPDPEPAAIHHLGSPVRVRVRRLAARRAKRRTAVGGERPDDGVALSPCVRSFVSLEKPLEFGVPATSSQPGFCSAYAGDASSRSTCSSGVRRSLRGRRRSARASAAGRSGERDAAEAGPLSASPAGSSNPFRPSLLEKGVRSGCGSRVAGCETPGSHAFSTADTPTRSPWSYTAGCPVVGQAAARPDRHAPLAALQPESLCFAIAAASATAPRRRPRGGRTATCSRRGGRCLAGNRHPVPGGGLGLANRSCRGSSGNEVRLAVSRRRPEIASRGARYQPPGRPWASSRGQRKHLALLSSGRTSGGDSRSACLPATGARLGGTAPAYEVARPARGVMMTRRARTSHGPSHGRPPNDLTACRIGVPVCDGNWEE